MNKKIAFAGMLLAVNVLLLFLINIIPNNTMFLMGLASLLVAVVVMEWGLKTGIAFYMGSALLGFLVMSNKVHWVVYVCTFAIYGIVKYLIEKDRPIYLEYVLKLVFANIAVFTLYFILRAIVYIPMNIFIILAFQVIFLVYDYAYTVFINYYNQKLRKMIFRG
jgi:hypothetical protein